MPITTFPFMNTIAVTTLGDFKRQGGLFRRAHRDHCDFSGRCHDPHLCRRPEVMPCNSPNACRCLTDECGTTLVDLPRGAVPALDGVRGRRDQFVCPFRKRACVDGPDLLSWPSWGGSLRTFRGQRRLGEFPPVLSFQARRQREAGERAARGRPAAAVLDRRAGRQAAGQNGLH